MQVILPCPPDRPLGGLRERALQALCLVDPTAKVAAVEALQASVLARTCPDADPDTTPNAEGLELPGRPSRPRLVDPSDVPQRSPFTPQGLAALLHAITHIEFNAINLALDAVWRFDGMPPAFYTDWLRVAAEEAGHFRLLQVRLQALDCDYGTFDAHDGLWTMCLHTAHDVIARMALVPRTLEARGLDATPLIQARLRKVGTPQAMEAITALDVILRDEVGHVAIGNHWYRWLCARHGLDPMAHYRVLARRHAAPRLRPPFNEEARRAAGFSAEEMDYLLGS